MEFKISDLTGLKEPLIKLIEVVSKGIGTVYEPRRIKKMAEARAYEIETISNALKSSEVNGEITYENEQFKVTTDLVNGEVSKPIIDRMLAREIKKQKNTDNIISLAYQELEQVEEVDKSEVDDDWISRFFNIVENISSEEMQIIWAKILAGEIISPNTYSLRTLEVLRNLSRHEAELFTKVGKLAIEADICTFILGKKEILDKQFGIKFSDLLLLDELNLINSTELRYQLQQNDSLSRGAFYYSDKIIIFEKNQSPLHYVPIFKFTKCGEELLKFITKEFNEDYIKLFASEVKNPHINLIYYSTIERKGRECTFDNEKGIVL